MREAAKTAPGSTVYDRYGRQQIGHCMVVRRLVPAFVSDIGVTILGLCFPLRSSTMYIRALFRPFNSQLDNVVGWLRQFGRITETSPDG